MSLKDLLSPELYDEVVHDAHDSGEAIVKIEGQPLKVKCPICKMKLYMMHLTHTGLFALKSAD